jgi:hypothetical protein
LGDYEDHEDVVERVPESFPDLVEADVLWGILSSVLMGERRKGVTMHTLWESRPVWFSATRRRAIFFSSAERNQAVAGALGRAKKIKKPTRIVTAP